MARPALTDGSTAWAYRDRIHEEDRPFRTAIRPVAARRYEMFIHPLARIVSVVDTYTAVTCARPHRWGSPPYTAMTLLLKEASTGRLDRQAVRAFLDCMPLFPVGSHVMLSDGCVDRVTRGNGPLHTRPMVVPVNSDGTESEELLDLSVADSNRVTAALDGSRLAGVEVIRRPAPPVPKVGA